MINSKDTISEFLEMMAIETVNIATTYIRKFTDDPDKIRLITTKLVSEIITELVVDSLHSYDKNSSKVSQLGQVETNFTNVKRALQIQIADGFNKAMYKYVGKDLDYYCQIKLATEPTDKKVIQ